MNDHGPRPTRAELDPLLCVHCPDLCLFACPAASGSGSTSFGPFGKVSALYWASRGALWSSPELRLVPYLCTGCGLCTEICAHDQPVADYLHAERVRLVQQRAAPPETAPILPGEEALREGVEEAAALIGQTAPPDLLFFPGCALLSEGAERVAQVVERLRRFGVEGVGLDPAGPVCCGAPWRDLGDTAGHLARSSSCRRAFSAREGVIVGDPRCFRALTEQLPDELRRADEPSLFPLWKVLARCLKGPMRHRLDIRVALHEPCHLARYLGRDRPPLELIGSLLLQPPLSLGFRGAESQCCGRAGGMAEVVPEVARSAGRALLERAAAIGAEAVLTLSLSCAAHFRGAREGRDDLPEVMDLTDLIERALDANLAPEG